MGRKESKKIIDRKAKVVNNKEVNVQISKVTWKTAGCPDSQYLARVNVVAGEKVSMLRAGEKVDVNVCILSTDFFPYSL